MTITEKVCNHFNTLAPNMDHETGIHYGVIPINYLDQDAVSDIYQNGTDLGWERAIEAMKLDCRSAAKAVAECDEEDIRYNVKAWLGDHLTSYDAKNLFNGLEEDLKNHEIDREEDELYEYFYNYMTEQCDVMYESEGPYALKENGLELVAHSDGDAFVIKSEFYTYCEECSPCAPNAGYLLNESDSMKAYCLGHEWFEGDKAPYKVFRVSDDAEVQPNGKR